MKLNPPETAPKDGSVIIADVGYPWLVPAVWNEHDEKWVCACLNVGMIDGKYVDTYFENEYENDSELKGWVLWPEK